MKIKGKYSESAVLYAILLTVGLVLGAAVFFIVLNVTGGKVPEVSLPSLESTTTAATAPAVTEPEGYSASAELADEMKDAAQELITDNYTVLRLYYTRGLSHKDEPYGNRPEDGYYTVDSENYSALYQLEEIVDRTFTPEFANEVKSNPLGYGAIYKTRADGSLGIIADFTPMPYEKSWNSPQFRIDPTSDTTCDITVTLHNKEDESEVDSEAEMVKTADGWRLTSIVF